MKKIFQFNFFATDGSTIESFVDVIDCEGARSFAKFHEGELKDCNSYSFTEMNYMDNNQLTEYLEEYEARNAFGIMDVNDIEDVSNASEKWFVGEVLLDSWHFTCDPNYPNQSRNLPVLIIDKNDFIVEVLDGKHRLGMAKAKGDKSIECIYGYFE